MTPLTDEQRAFLRQCCLEPDELQWDVMDRLCRDLLEANRRVNLTRITGREEFLARHVLDSLSVGRILPELARAPLRLADVGCGAGFPLLPLAWAWPKQNFTGIESRGKKADFVRAEAALLGLANVTIAAMPVRQAGQCEELAEQFDAVLLRAVGPAAKMIRPCRILLRHAPGAKILLYKTPAAVERERREARREADKYHFVYSESDPFSLPHRAGDRQFLIFSRP